MSDVVSPEKRSQMMSGIRGKDTRPEMVIRRRLHALGFRYKLHDQSLPGHPDLVFPSRKAVIFVHGCFWHMHDCHLFKWPSTRREFWAEKLAGNARRDQANLAKLQEEGWRVLVVWECALKGKTKLPESDVVRSIANWLRTGDQIIKIEGARLSARAIIQLEQSESAGHSGSLK